jgi:hypothetical protein
MGNGVFSAGRGGAPLVEEEARAARARLDAWRSETGEVLEALIQKLKTDFPNIPSSVAADPEFARSEALSAVGVEAERCAALLAQDDADATRLQQIRHNVKIAESRIAKLDQEISEIAGDVKV